MVLSIERINKARESGYNDEQILEAIQSKDSEFGQRIQKAKETGYDSASILQSIEKRLNTPVNTPANQQNTPANPSENSNVKPLYIEPNSKEKGLIKSFESGLKSSATGQLSQAVFNNKTQEELAEDPGFWEELAHSGGSIAGDLPYMLAGGTIGSALGASTGALAGPAGAGIGSLIGGGAGALALPTFLKEALKEYNQHQGDLTFGEFLQQADRVASKTLKEGLFGSILGTINKAMPMLSKLPGVGKLFTSKGAQKAAGITTETAAAATIPAITEGRLPQGKDFAHAAAIILGFNAAKLPRAIREKIQQRGEASGLTPEEFAKTPEAKEIINEAVKEPVKEIEVPIQKPQGETNQKAETPKEDVKPLDNKDLYTKSQHESDVKKAFGEAYPQIKQGRIQVGLQESGITKNGETTWQKEYLSSMFVPEIKVTITASGKTQAESISNLIKEMESSTGLKPDVKPLYIEKKVVVNPKELSIDQPKVEKPAEPIIEVTGQGAEQTLEEPATTLSKLKEKASNLVESVSNPYQLQKEIYTKSFDALEPINRLEVDVPVEERVTTKIKQAQSAASDINNILTQGIFDNVSNTFTSGSLRDVYTESGEVWKKATKGLKEAEYTIRDMDIYRTSKEALKRQKKGLKSGIDTSVAEKDVARLRQKYGPIDQRLREFQSKTLNHYGKDLLGDKVINQWTNESHASLYRIMDYGKDAIVAEGSLAPKKPWYKAKGSERKIIPPSESDIQNLSMLVSNSKKNDSVLQYKKLVEQGKLPGKIVKSKNRAIPEKMLEDLGIDPENEALAESLYNQSRKDSFTPDTGRIRGWENGKPFEIEVPRDVYETYSSLAPSDTGMLTNLFRATNNIMSRGIVLEPVKFGSIFLRDAYSSLIYSKTGSNPLSIVKALNDIYKDTHSWNQFKSLGGEQYASRLMTRTERVGKIEELLKAEQPNAVLIPFKNLSQFLKKHSQNLVASVPFAEYQRAVEKFGDTPSGRLQALIEAKSVTYDPTKKGSSKLVKGSANFFPFFNVMLQEPAMIAKNMKRPMFWAKGALGMTLPSLLLKMYNEGNPDYDDMNPLLKSSCWHFYTDAGHFAVPVPWLLGALFKGMPEVFYDYAKGEGGDTWKGLYSYIASQLSGSFPPIVQAAVEQSTNRSLPSPAALALMPFADVEKRAPPVVPKRLENLPPEQQYTSKTSQLARWYGNLWGASPVKVERLIKTFGGGLASDALALIDEMAYASNLVEDKRPEQGAKNYLLLGKFLSENTPSNTKYTSEFYNLLEQSKIEKKRGNPNKHNALNQANMKISAKLRKYRDIEEKSMDPKRKREELQQLQKEINTLYKESVLKNR